MKQKQAINELVDIRKNINDLWPKYFKSLGWISVADAVLILNGFSTILDEIDKQIVVLRNNNYNNNDDANNKI